MALTDLEISTLVERYFRERDRVEKMAATVMRHLTARLRDEGIPHVPTFRSKDPESVRSKLQRDHERHEYASFEHEFTPSVLDLAGVRVLLYRPQDVEVVCAVVEDLFDIPEGGRFRRCHANPGGYQAHHRVVALKNDILDSDPALANLHGVLCEIQTVTLGDHIWNELEHDIKYKTPTGTPSESQNELLCALRAGLDTVNKTVARLMEATERQKAQNLSAITMPEDLRQALQLRSGRALRGDFGRLLRLLNGSLRDVTPAELSRLPLGPSDLDEAAELAARANLEVASDDVRLVVAALWTELRPAFVEVVGSWPGKRGPVARFVLGLDAAAQKGRI